MAKSHSLLPKLIHCRKNTFAIAKSQSLLLKLTLVNVLIHNDGIRGLAFSPLFINFALVPFCNVCPTRQHKHCSSISKDPKIKT